MESNVPVAAKEEELPARPKMIFVSGDRASVGKSTVALGLLGSLLRTGLYKPNEVAYIKPATQCIDVQLVSKFCNMHGIMHRGIGPVVFYTGFTRECIDGQGPSPKELLDKIETAVNTISQGKKFVIVDGVGYPSVGSVVGVSNAQIAQRLGIPVLLVGRSGVGDAIDSFNLNKVYFNYLGVKVLGAVFNKVEEPFDDIKDHVTRYFEQTYPDVRAYGFIPLAPHLGPKDGIRREKGACQRETPITLAISEEEKIRAEAVITAFVEHVDVMKIVGDRLSILEERMMMELAQTQELLEESEARLQELETATQGWRLVAFLVAQRTQRGARRLRRA